MSTETTEKTWQDELSKPYWKTRIYNIWCGMKQRCDNINNTNYNIYGGRGIKYCHTWKSFINFYNDMKDMYQDGLTLERNNNDWGYSKENCKWITQAEQARNTSRNIFYKGKCLAEWAEKLGLKYDMLYSRYKRSNSLEETIRNII